MAGALWILFVVASAGALDAYTWERWFRSIISNVELNVFAHVSDGFGTAPGYDYPLELGLRSAGLGYLGALGLALSWRKIWLLSVMGVAYLSALPAFFGHKEWRFLMPLDPIYMIGRVPWCLLPMDGVSARWWRRLLSPWWRRRLHGSGDFGPRHGNEARAQGRPPSLPDVVATPRMLSRLPDVSGVIDDSGGNWLHLGGYYYPHQAAPLYRDDVPATNVARVCQSPQRFASHWLTPEDVNCAGRLCLVGAERQDRDLATQQGSARNAHRTRLLYPYPGSFDGKTISPRVTPRWSVFRARKCGLLRRHSEFSHNRDASVVAIDRH
jgi:hypothetical protein